MYCPNCGIENPNDGEFCSKCGATLVEGLNGLRYARVAAIIFAIVNTCIFGVYYYVGVGNVKFIIACIFTVWCLAVLVIDRCFKAESAPNRKAGEKAVRSGWISMSALVITMVFFLVKLTELYDVMMN